MSSHPIQPVALDSNGVIRFKANAIIRKLVDDKLIDLNEISCWDIPKDDRSQFAQLMGYSLSGYGSLSFSDDLTYTAAYHMHHDNKTELEAKVEYLENLVATLKDALRGPMAELFGMHEEDIP